jgi:hypothetical protein
VNLLLLATKAPWPPIDGGRLLLLHTLEALAGAGARLTLVAPVEPARFDLAEVAAALAPWCEPRLVPAGPAPVPAALLRSALTNAPLSIARHTLPAVRREAAHLLATRRFDAVHVEQLQALAQAEPARRHGVPIILRAQNVESDLWREVARRSGGIRGRALGWEARRLACREGEGTRRAVVTLALSTEDATRLRELGGAGAEGRIQVVRAPFPAAAGTLASPLPGDPAVVVLGSRGWLPNEDSHAWLLQEIWPAVRSALPEATLHLYGAGLDPGMSPAGVTAHSSPEDSAQAFATGSVLLVPLRIASGVRMKILEAWARGVPVVATPTALAGLEAEDGRDALAAADPAGFARALKRLRDEPGLATSLVEAGRRSLAARHDPARVARDLLAVYERAAAS